MESSWYLPNLISGSNLVLCDAFTPLSKHKGASVRKQSELIASVFLNTVLTSFYEHGESFVKKKKRVRTFNPSCAVCCEGFLLTKVSVSKLR